MIKKTGHYHITTKTGEIDGMISVAEARKIFTELERIGVEIGSKQFEKKEKGIGKIVIPDGFEYNSSEKYWHWNGDKDPMPHKVIDFFSRVIDQLLESK